MKFPLRNLILLVLMLAASGMAVALKPTKKIADQGPRFNLEAAIPERFGEWRIDPFTTPVALSPDVQAKLDAIYDQTLSRTYVNEGGQRVMLSIAYGGDQSTDKTQVHRPEFCYAAQGFQLSKSSEDSLSLEEQKLIIRRLTATHGARNEPISYWLTVGDQVALPGIGRKLLQIRYGISGRVPDGMLVRVSSISDNITSAYELQDDFIKEMLSATRPENRIRLAGKLSQ
jgi:EpsI family protein